MLSATLPTLPSLLIYPMLPSSSFTYSPPLPSTANVSNEDEYTSPCPEYSVSRGLSQKNISHSRIRVSFKPAVFKIASAKLIVIYLP